MSKHIRRESLHSSINRGRSVRTGGFTLIELLVVVAIIAVLISILLPSLAGARKQAKQVLCLTNVRSIGEASSFYAQEYNDWVIANENQDGVMPRPGVPIGYPRDDSYSHTQFAISLLNGLLYDHPVRGLYRSFDQQAMIDACGDIPQLQCPTHPKPEQKLDYIVNAFVQPYTVGNIRAERSLQYGGGGFQGDGVLEIAFSHNLNRFKVPHASLIYITEGHESLPHNTLLYHDTFYTHQLPFASAPRIANDQRHPGGITNIFFDGHAEVMTLTRTDARWPYSHGIRLKWFTIAPEGYW